MENTSLETTPSNLTGGTYLRIGVAIWMMGAVAICHAAAETLDPGAVPHLNERGRTAFQAFAAAEKHRAFAIAPGGAWGWQGGEPSEGAANDAALEACQAQSEQRCVLYASDSSVKFKAAEWPTLWRPFLSKAEAERANTGIRRGERFHDLVFATPAGKSRKLSDLRGKVVLLHFWGSWCPSCRRELPELSRLQAELAARKDVELVLLQVRESAATARQWLVSQKLALPTYDALGDDHEQESLQLPNGTSIGDRQLAKVFPTTFVLDKRGIVVFSHTGPVENWLQYLPFIADAAASGGKGGGKGGGKSGGKSGGESGGK